MTQLDLSGEVCPYTFIRSKLALEEVAPGTLLEITVNHQPAVESVPRSLVAHGHQVLDIRSPTQGTWIIQVRKRLDMVSTMDGGAKEPEHR